MKAVGEILKNKRLEKNLSLGQVEKATKIRIRYLEAIEKNDFSKIPGGAQIAKGFIKNYSDFLELSSASVLAVFRRDFQESRTGQIIPRGMVEPLDGPKFTWTPKLTVIAALAVLFFLLGSYIFSQYSASFFAPKLEVSSPKNNENTAQGSLEFKGKTDSDATLFINQEMKIVNQDGSFSEKVSLSTGENDIVVEAVNRRGQKSKVIRRIQYQP